MWNGCATDLIGEPSDLSIIEYPTGLAIHPNGRYAYLIGSNFDLDYRANDGGAIYVLDLETKQILPSSKRIGSFGTNVVLSEDARRGYTVTRGDDALVWFEISEDGSQISCPNEKENSESLLKCRRLIDDNPSYVAITRSYREKTEINANGESVTTTIPFDLLAIAQLRNAQTTMMTVQTQQDGSLSFSHESASLLYSASVATWFEGEKFVVAGRSASNILVISPALDDRGRVLGIYASQAISVPSGYNIYQGRDLVFDPGKRDMFMLNQYPRALMKFDVSGLSNVSATSDRAALTDMLMLSTDVTRMIWVGDGETGMIYATSSTDNTLFIIDPRAMEIVETIETGNSPYEMALHGDKLYLVLFRDNEIWQFDVSKPNQPELREKLFSTNPSTDLTGDK